MSEPGATPNTAADSDPSGRTNLDAAPATGAGRQPKDPPVTVVPSGPQPGSVPSTAPSTDAPPSVDLARTMPHVGSDAGTPTAEPAETPLPQLPGYEVLSVLGKGGMGIVYKARQRGLGRGVALKMILTGAHAGARERGRFRREAEAVARLQHPAIIQIYEIGEYNGQPYLSLELVEGGSLDRRLKGTRLSAREAAAMARQLAEAVAYAHQHGVVHRDLKPANILLTAESAPKISDFGLAKYLEEEGGQTQDGAVLGTPGYMAPEQAQGQTQQVGPAADIWAQGAILYEMLTGRPPFKGATVWDTLQMVRTGEPISPRLLQNRVPRDLETICLKCLQKEPRRRYTTAADLAEDLRRFLAGESILARPVGAAEQLWRWCRRNPSVALLWSLVLALLAAIAVTSTVGYYNVRTERDAVALQRRQAQENFELASQEKARAEANEQAARKHAALATEHLIQLIGRMERRLKAHPGDTQDPATAALHRDLVHMGRQTLTEMTRDFDRVGVTSFARALALQRLGDLFHQLGDTAEARHYYQQTLGLIDAIGRQHPEMDRARANRALLLAMLGNLTLEQGGDLREARENFRRALALQQEVASHGATKEYSLADNHRLLANYLIQLARASLRLGDPAEARALAEEAVVRRKELSESNPSDIPARSYLAEAYALFGETAWHTGDFAAARDAYDKALAVCVGLAHGHPGDASFQVDVVQVASEYSEALLRAGKDAEAAALLAEHMPKLEALVKRKPEDLSLRSLHAASSYRYGLVQLRRGRPEEAGKQFREARRLWQELLVAEPANINHQLASLVARVRCGEIPQAPRQAWALAEKTAAPHQGVALPAARCLAQAAAMTSETGDRHRYQDEALTVLQRLAEGGWKDTTALQTDPDLAPLQGHPRWQPLLKRLQAATIGQR